MSILFQSVYNLLTLLSRRAGLFIPVTLEIDEKRKRAMVVLSAFIGIPVMLLFMYQDSKSGDLFGVVLESVLAFVFILFLVATGRVKNGIWFYRAMLVGLACTLLYYFYYGRSGESSIVWMMVFPLIVFYVFDTTESVCWYLLFTLTGALVLFLPKVTGAYTYSIEMRIRFSSAYVVISCLSLTLEFLRWYFYTQLEKQRLELKEAMEKVKTLNGLVPICSICKNIRDDKGYWNKLEEYLVSHTDATLTHGICDKCYSSYYPKEYAHRNGLQKSDC